MPAVAAAFAVSPTAPNPNIPYLGLTTTTTRRQVDSPPNPTSWPSSPSPFVYLSLRGRSLLAVVCFRLPSRRRLPTDMIVLCSKVHRTAVYHSVWVVRIGSIGDWYRRYILVCRYAPPYHVSVRRGEMEGEERRKEEEEDNAEELVRRATEESYWRQKDRAISPGLHPTFWLERNSGHCRLFRYFKLRIAISQYTGLYWFLAGPVHTIPVMVYQHIVYRYVPSARKKRRPWRKRRKKNEEKEGRRGSGGGKVRRRKRKALKRRRGRKRKQDEEEAKEEEEEEEAKEAGGGGGGGRGRKKRRWRKMRRIRRSIFEDDGA
ncbi:hypothetical protein GW17_00003429 [Ensete ventricosum]|nr:hypothetical protein GW17_00003429 [Ensete ventricosum]